MSVHIARFGATGNRIGILTATAPDGNNRTIVIAPKVWRNGSQSKRRFSLKGDDPWVVHEGDRLFAEVGSTEATFLLNLSIGLPREIMEIGYGATPGEDESAEPIPKAEPMLDALLGLFQFAMNDIDDADIVLGSRGDLSDAVHRRQLVVEVERSFRTIRPRYVSKIEQSKTWRGAVVVDDLFRSRAERRVAIEFDHDELTSDLLEWRLVMTALEMVASPRTKRVVAHDDPDLRRRAIAVRRRLSDIVALPLSQIGGSIQRLEQLRYDSRFSALETAARAVLTQDLMGADMEGERIAAHGVILRSEALWELILGKAATQRWGAARVHISTSTSLAPGLISPQPWAKAPGRKDSFPDLVLEGPDRVFCIDAKYKILERGASRADLYQIFTYSHVVGLKSAPKKPVDVALIYPSSPRDRKLSQEPGWPSANREYRRSGEPAGPVFLKVLELPFPTPAQARHLLRGYLFGLADALEESLGLPDALEESFQSPPAAPAAHLLRPVAAAAK